MKPIIKWAGGKTQLLDEIRKRMPVDYDLNQHTYCEPFVGGGAVYFALQAQNAIINDVNLQLINCYEQVRNNLKLLKELLDLHTIAHNEEYYYNMRTFFNTRILNNELDVVDASVMIYLNKAGYNGLYRVNQQGYFNTPSGKRKTVALYNEDNLDECSKYLQNTIIMSVDFEEACINLKKGDFVFFDSPYYQTFDTYQAGGFSEDDHKRLAALFEQLTKRGVYCLLTNSDSEFIRELYGNYTIDTIEVKRMINCDGNKRTGRELIITNYNY